MDLPWKFSCRVPLAMPVFFHGTARPAFHWRSQWHTTFDSSLEEVPGAMLSRRRRVSMPNQRGNRNCQGANTPRSRKMCVGVNTFKRQ